MSYRLIGPAGVEFGTHDQEILVGDEFMYGRKKYRCVKVHKCSTITYIFCQPVS